MPVKGGSKCIKYLLFGFNFIFWVSERRLSRALLSEATCSQAREGVRGGECSGCRERGEPPVLRAPGGLRASRERRSGCQLAGRDWQVDGRSKWVGEPRVLVAPAVHFAPGSFYRRVFEMGSVPAPTRSTPGCERGVREEQSNLFE